MSSVLPPDPGLYTDMSGLQGLRSQARRDDPAAIREVARQFEAVLLQTMLKSMRQAQTIDDGGLGDSDQTRFYRDMHDQQLALTLARGRGVGLAEMLERQILHQSGQTPAADAAPGEAAALAPPTLNTAHRVLDQVHGIAPRALADEQRRLRDPQVSREGGVPAPFRADSPEGFVRMVWPAARRAGMRLGVAPEVLIAQAALESNWGRSVPRHADGSSSHNLFGIKANSAWSGPKVVSSTLEIVDGVPVREKAAFRSYAGFAESFADYADFVRNNPRYADALRVARDSNRYLHELHRAGYATDPDYAGKIRRILNGETLTDALSSLKTASLGPIRPTDGS